MNTKITATHDSGSQIAIVRKSENVTSTVRFMKSCGYVAFTFEDTTETSKTGR